MEKKPCLTRFSKDVERKIIEVFGNESGEVLKSLMQPVHTYYFRCNTHKISPGELIRILHQNGLRVMQNESVNEALGIRVEGPFDISEAERTVIVDKKTAESVLQGANVYAPGIVDAGSMRFGDRVTVLSELGEAIAIGKAEMNANEVLTHKKGLGVSICNRRYQGPQICELEEFKQGLIYPQSLAAMVTTRVLAPQPGETIVDMNCAPGGKLSHISQLMENEGKIYGFDRNSHKISQTRKIVSILACKNLILSIHDSRYIPEDFPELEPDRVLIDPPCSALGLRPKLYDFTTQERIENLAAYQKQFIKAASRIVKPGGTIVYSVCTFTLEECEMITDFAVRECNLRLIQQKPMLGSVGLGAIQSGALCQRFHPHTHEIGYFIAKFER
jgi:16S rRNA (cytosine967-C5)-methyltransferase